MIEGGKHMSEILAFAEASASDPKLSADPVPDTEAGHTTTDTLKAPSASSEKEEKAFFEMVGNFLLQQKQKKVIEGNLF